MKQLPFLLIYSRIVIGCIIACLAFFGIENKEILIVILMSIGLLTDIFDGIIARQQGVSSKRLRILDSNVDQFFWLTIIISVFYLNIDFIKANYLPIVVIFILEALAYFLSYVKFKKTIATHSLLAKFWTLTLLTFLIDLTLHSRSHIIFTICIVLGIISRIEIIGIVLLLKKWATDIPSIFVVGKVNRGENVKKSKWFNG